MKFLAVNHWVSLTLASVSSDQKDQNSVILLKSIFHKKSEIDQHVMLLMIIQETTIIFQLNSDSEDSIIATDLILRLRVNIDSLFKFQKEFWVANDKFVKALERVVLEVIFVKESFTQLFCTFYIFTHLIMFMIMRMFFLNFIETLVKYKHRLQAYTSLIIESLQLCSLNSSRCHLYCQMNSEANLANANIDSEIELMSLIYVQKRDFNMITINTWSFAIQFADESTSDLARKMMIQIVLDTCDDFKLSITFYVLRDFTCNILFEEDFLYEMNAFEIYRNAFSITNDYESCNVNTIVWFNMIEWSLSCLWKEHKRREKESNKFTYFVIFQQSDVVLTIDCY